jgi:protein involved in polysaccharide export with SLBB domain
MNRLMRGALSTLAVTVAVSSAAHPQASDPSNAPLKPGDRLLVKIWLDTAFADTVRIDETGAAMLPRLGPMHITDLASRGIADSVWRAYTRVTLTPSIEVTPLRRITVLGEVKQPATYFMETRSTLREAIALAGGVTDIGALKQLILIRDTTRIPIENWQRRADDVSIVRSGDVIWVEREPWLKRNIFSVISGLGVLFTVLYTATR